jgi:GT2 family glycosyltransferase
LRALAASLVEGSPRGQLSIFIHDNSPSPEAMRALREELASSGDFARVELAHAPENPGFGRGHNANAKLGSAPFILVLNPDCVLEPGALAQLLAAADTDPADVAAWEMRQIPFEHPKAYDPVSLDTCWVSGAATLLRRRHFEEAGGFDPEIFLYGEDVDLSWRLRARGRRLRYLPRAAVVHHTYATTEEVKPQQAFGAVYAGLALRTRYGRARSVAKGVLMWGAEVLAPETFPGRRRGIVDAGLRFARHARHFLRTRVASGPTFSPQFTGWSYEVRRDGAFHPMRSRRGRPPSDFPLVSVLVRTVNRAAWLREALASCANQTYPNLEVVVVEDGEHTSRAIVDEFAACLALRYIATGARVGRARAGNIAMQQARGEWFNFLDDDDVLFADHIEVLVDAARDAGARGAFGYAWETSTRVADRDQALYTETANIPRHRPAFDRARLWRQNFLPIQAVLFHRSLWEEHGGFAEDMDQLEDWNLWTRYTLEEDFVAVPKTTSKYRVPDDAREAARRQALLDAAYPCAVARQQALRARMSPRRAAELDDARAREAPRVTASRALVRRIVGSSRTLSWLAAWRHPTRAWLRRRGIWS